MTPTPAEIYKQLSQMTPAERILMLEKENPMKALFEKRKEDAFNAIREYIDTRISNLEQEYKQEYGNKYIDAMYEDKVYDNVCQTYEFDKLIKHYFEYCI